MQGCINDCYYYCYIQEHFIRVFFTFEPSFRGAPHVQKCPVPRKDGNFAVWCLQPSAVDVDIHTSHLHLHLGRSGLHTINTSLRAWTQVSCCLCKNTKTTQQKPSVVHHALTCSFCLCTSRTATRAQTEPSCLCLEKWVYHKH